MPTSTANDGGCDDVNGNGRKDVSDVVLYFNQMIWIAANGPVAAFDYNGNYRIDFADVVWLFNHLRSSNFLPGHAAPPGSQEERRRMCNWCLRRHYLWEFVVTTDQVFTDRLGLGACSDEGAPLFPVSAKGGPADSKGAADA